MSEKKSKWIWYSGDFELYHNMLLSCRRQELGVDYPCVWRTSRPEVNVLFYKEAFPEKDGVIRVVTRSKGYVAVRGVRYPVNTDIYVEKGRNEIDVLLYDIEKFPSFFIKGDVVVSDETWVAHCGDGIRKQVGAKPAFYSENDDPSVFPFCYKPIEPVKSEKINGGTLYDFGVETFGPVTLSEIEEGDSVELQYGESRNEALDTPENVTVRDVLSAGDCLERPARAFRYLFVRSKNGREPMIKAEYEYLPVEDKALFRADEETNKIWDICSYTFHLNSREFFLDGIKRDRWVWSGDAYQSFMINRYLFADSGITERTIRALLGDGKYTSHVNTINDYSAYLIFSVLEHYRYTKDIDFVKSVWDKVKALFGFIVSRLDENGYVVKKPNDWIFIDWGDVDKGGTLCAEQILLCHLYGVMNELCTLMNEENDYDIKKSELKKKIIADYWREDRNAFVDCFDSGKEHISMQTNIFAIIFGIVDRETAAKIKASVLDNGSVAPVTTPYFKFYELIARCMCGEIKQTVEFMKSYWGSMIKLGATTVWEQFDPQQSGEEHYKMYGKKYGKSLCHAWGSGPIYILGRFIAGVDSMPSNGYEFTVSPSAEAFESFCARVPVSGGEVSVKLENGKCEILASASGGAAVINGKTVPLEANRQYIFEIE